MYQFVTQLLHNAYTMGISTKIRTRKDFIKKDGTSPIYLRLIIDRKWKDIPMHIDVHQKHFDEKKQEVKKSHPKHADININY